jgi:hypothetical protein
MLFSLTNAQRWFLRTPEVNLVLFAFLVNFVYEVWQTPFYDIPDRGDPQAFVSMLFHCAAGDALISLACFLMVGVFMRNRHWILELNLRHIVAFTALGLIATVIIETYRLRVIGAYGVSVFPTPWLGISGFALLQWAVLPCIVLALTRRHLLGYKGERSKS